MKYISVRGACEHNLKNTDVDIPKNSLVAFTGVSGSGKSSLVFDTIYIEAFRRFADASHVPIYMLGSTSWAKLSRPRFRSITGLPPALGLSQRQGVAGKTSTVGTISAVSDLFRVYYAAFGDIFCRNCDIPLRATLFPDLMAHILIQFKHKKVMIISPIVEKRRGAFQAELDKFRELGFSKLRLNGVLFDLQSHENLIKIDPKKLNTIDVIIDYVVFSPEKKQRIERALLQALDYGKGVVKLEIDGFECKFNTKSNCPQCGESAPKLDPRYFSHSSLGQCSDCDGTGSSLHSSLHADLFPCKKCKGTRLSPFRPIVRVKGKTYEELHMLKIHKLYEFVVSELETDAQSNSAKLKVFSEIKRSLFSVIRLGLSHLILNRAGNSLSPGELQRLRLSSMISNKLSGVLYVIDEPCQGLTIGEIDNVLSIFKEILTTGASLICVEHHPYFLKECQNLILIGPGAGEHGGKIVLITQKYSDIEKYFAELIRNSSESDSRLSDDYTQIQQNSVIFYDMNVRSVFPKKVTIKQNKVNLIRGQSGTGKSTFLDIFLMPFLLNKITKKGEIDLDLSIPAHTFCKVEEIGNIKVNNISFVKPGSMTRSSRRIVASALDVLVSLRELFSKLPSSLLMGLSESYFSWSSKLGRCEKCEGRGYIELPQKYADPVRVECEICLGAKLNSRSLLPRYKGFNFSDIMNFSIDEAIHVFENHKIIQARLMRASQFGLGYIRLGQGMDSLSGGELQRLNLTIELKRTNLDGSWFILLHPSTGLHSPDIRILGELITLMQKQGATFVLVENRDEFLEFSSNTTEF